MHKQKLGLQLLAHRQRFGGVEVDLLFRQADGDLLLVEVKSARFVLYRDNRLGRRQRLRLQKAIGILEEDFNLPVHFELALVDEEQCVSYFDWEGGFLASTLTAPCNMKDLKA